MAKDKPLVVSVGGMAASGGYYLASSGDYIFADPAGIVGSIGVVGGKFVTKDLFDKVGLSTEFFAKGRNAGLFSSNKEWDERQRRMVRNWMQQTYDQFTPEEKAELSALYESMPPGDEPPFPIQGMRPPVQAFGDRLATQRFPSAALCPCLGRDPARYGVRGFGRYRSRSYGHGAHYQRIPARCCHGAHCSGVLCGPRHSDQRQELLASD